MCELVSPLCLILNSLEIVIRPTHCYSFYFIVFRAMVLRLQKHQSHLRLSKTQTARPYPRGSDSVGQVGPIDLHFYNLAFLGMLLVKGLPFVKHYCEVKLLDLDSEKPGCESPVSYVISRYPWNSYFFPFLLLHP